MRFPVMRRNVPLTETEGDADVNEEGEVVALRHEAPKLAQYVTRFQKNWRGKYTLLIGTMKSSGFVGKSKARPADSSRPRKTTFFSKRNLN